MAESLSQADIDALLDTFAAPEREGSAPKGEKRETSLRYDFSHPELLSRDQVRAIRTLHEGYAQALAKRLSTELLANVSASVVAVDHLTYSEFLMLLPTPTVLCVIEIPELEGNIAIELNPSLAFSFVDRLLGGVGEPLAKARSLTTIEQGLMEGVLQKSCRELELIWQPVMDLSLRLHSIEGNPELARIVSPEEMIIFVPMELRMNDVKGMMNLCLPYVVMEPAIHRLGQGTTYPQASLRASAAVREALGRSVRECPVSLDVDLGTVPLTVREILDLEAGDVLRITPASPSGARAQVEGAARLDGEPGRSRGHVAFRVREVHPRPNEEEGEEP